MDTNDRIRINNANVVHETIDGETVILNLVSGNYYSLKGTGAHIWDYLEKGAGVNDLVERLHCDYNEDKEDMESAINKFLTELINEGLTTPDTSDPSIMLGTSNDQAESVLTREKCSFTPPVLNKYTDMQDLLLLDPIHEVDDKKGWPTRNPDLPGEN